ncbi:hypothetical protein BGZ49_003236 [Haplosporangium sp. Z 27]|nr:hypothetical protein BGZ49_003236 [Haplosporangium sp. Z 27]
MSPLHTSIGVLLLLISIPQFSNAQVPVAVSGPAFARTNTRLYIAGGIGYNNSVTYKQFFSLNLAVPWNTSAPAWTQLHDGPQQNIFPAVFSADQKTMITFHSGTPFANLYSVDLDEWTPSQVQAQADLQGVGAVLDNVTGLVYLAGGYSDGTRNSMDTYSFANDAFVQSALPSSATAFPDRAYYSNVWTSQRKSILYFGGYNSSLSQIPNYSSITEFVPSTGTWSTLVTTNTGPSMRSDHCMAISDDGSTMIIFGGRPYSGIFSGEVFIFDTVGQSWRQGLTGPPRVYVACTIAGDNLIVWGGIDANSNIASPAMLIYNLSNNTWITQYTPPASYLSSNSTSTSTNGGSNHAGAIAGGVVGGVAIICAIVLFFIFWRRRQRRDPVKAEESSDYKHISGTGAPEGEIQSMRVQLQHQQEQLDLQRRLLESQQAQQQSSFQVPYQQIPQPLHQQYQDVAYNYQPVLYSPTSLTSPYSQTSPGVISHSSPDYSSTGIVPVSSEHGYNGYIDGGSQYVEAQGATPVVYTPPASNVATATVHITKGSEGSSWEERTPGNPHALIES